MKSERMLLKQLLRSEDIRLDVLERLLVPRGRHAGVSALGVRGALALAWAAVDEASSVYETVRRGGGPVEWPQHEGWRGRLIERVDPRDMAWEVLESIGPGGLPHRYRALDFLAAAVRFRRAQDAARRPEERFLFSAARELVRFCGLVLERRSEAGFEHASMAIVDSCGLASALRPGGCADVLAAAVRRAGPYLD